MPRGKSRAGSQGSRPYSALTDVGIEYEADPRHQAAVLEELKLENCRPVTTPFGPEVQGCLPGQSEPLEAEEATRYRESVARLNYLALDRPARQVAVQEAAKRVSAPHTHTHT